MKKDFTESIAYAVEIWRDGARRRGIPLRRHRRYDRPRLAQFRRQIRELAWQRPPRAGAVKELLVTEKQQVAEGQALIVLAT
jgi:hypothetical protein